MIVVDTNIIAYFLIQGDHTTQARQLREIDPHWSLPALWQHELLNVLVCYAGQYRASVEDMLGIWRYANDLFGAATLNPDMESSLLLAVEYKISAYDAQFVSLAQQLQTRLVTEDKLLLKRFPETAVSLRQVLQ